jgi:hypothetical protein
MSSQGKWKQWYGNGLLWKVETVVLKWAGQEKFEIPNIEVHEH